MKTTYTSERGLERLICTALIGDRCGSGSVPCDVAAQERPAVHGVGWPRFQQLDGGCWTRRSG